MLARHRATASACRAEQRRIGYVFQDARLFPHYTVRGNLLYGARAQRRAPALFDDVVALLGLAPLLAAPTRRAVRRRATARGTGSRAAVASRGCCCSMNRWPRWIQSRREEVLPYLERLRDHFAIPMVYVSHQFDEVLRLATHLVVMDEGRVTAAGDVGTVSRAPALRAIVGPDAVGAVIDGRVVAIDAAADLATVDDGPAAVLRVTRAGTLAPDRRVRLQLLARDLILALSEPRGLSVRNQLRGTRASHCIGRIGRPGRGGLRRRHACCRASPPRRRASCSLRRHAGLGAGQGRFSQPAAMARDSARPISPSPQALRAARLHQQLVDHQPVHVDHFDATDRATRASRRPPACAPGARARIRPWCCSCRRARGRDGPARARPRGWAGVRR